MLLYFENKENSLLLFYKLTHTLWTTTNSIIFYRFFKKNKSNPKANEYQHKIKILNKKNTKIKREKKWCKKFVDDNWKWDGGASEFWSMSCA